MIVPLTTSDVLQRITDWLGQRTPFLHLRFGDGDFNWMFRLVPVGTKLGHNRERCLPELCEASLEAFEGVVQANIAGKRVLVGSYLPHVSAWAEHQLGAKEGLAAKRHLEAKGWWDKVQWCESDLWYSTAYEEVLERSGERPTGTMDLLLGMLRSVRDGSKPSVLIGCRMIREAAACLSARFVEVSQADSILHTNQVMDQCRHLAERGATFVWCAGAAGKCWAWKLWRDYPQSSHVDAGSLFDGACGWRSRMWTMRDLSPHWLEYQKRFTPFVKGTVK